MRIAIVFVAVLVSASAALADIAPPPDSPPPEPPKPEVSAAQVPDQAPAPAATGASPTSATSQAAPAKDPLLEPEPLLVDSPSTYEGVVGTFVRTMLMLALVLGLVYLVLHKGLGQLVAKQRQGQRIRVVERVPLEQKRALYLVQVDGREILLASTDNNVVQLTTPEAQDPGFKGALEQTRARGVTQEGGGGAVPVIMSTSSKAASEGLG